MITEKDKQIMKERGIALPVKECNCSYCRHDYKVIGIKKARKFYSSEISKLKKGLKHLKDKGIKYGYLGDYNQEPKDIQKLRNDFAAIRETLDWTKLLKYRLYQVKRGIDVK